jgi:hypothetical protein
MGALTEARSNERPITGSNTAKRGDR